jgi:hypothetical protein
VPVAGVDAWVEGRGVESFDLVELVRLANAFGVSCETALWRAKAARRIAPGAAERLKKRLDAREHHGLRALESGLIDEERAAQRLRLSVPALHAEVERQAAGGDES